MALNLQVVIRQEVVAERPNGWRQPHDTFWRRLGVKPSMRPFRIVFYLQPDADPLPFLTWNNHFSSMNHFSIFLLDYPTREHHWTRAQ